jgi:hypothetical protein
MSDQIPRVSDKVDRLCAGQVVILNDGTMARVVEIARVEHEVKHTVPLAVVTYELLDGPWKGARSSTPLLGSDEVDVVPAPAKRRRLFGIL